ncbi:hypothetical protein V2I01_23085 [Micromonospora sp. BRA006-A]|nr:hypothetical protein [Micromonospora sp. BRA006-A]
MLWQPGSALLLAGLEWLDGSARWSPARQILRRQLDRLGAAHGLTAYAGTELEFVLCRDSYEEAWPRYRDLTPANQYSVDYFTARHRPGRAAAAPCPHREPAPG